MSSLVVAAAVLLAALMGLAIQRGGTCLVAAVDELVHARRATRLAALLEAALWVLAGLVVLRALGWIAGAPAVGHAAGVATMVGGVLLGLGAWLNRACVFGAVARFGSGEVAYLATPLGFYAGCVLAGRGRLAPPAMLQDGVPPAFGMAAWAGGLLLAVLAWRVLRPWWRTAHAPWRTRVVWSPRVATAVIGITFLLLLVTMGAWAYTDVLAELARGMGSGPLAVRGALLLALFAGAAIGGWCGGRWRAVGVTPVQLARCTLGGALMGLGSQWAPGGNDGLILLGMPLLWPYAWLAFVAMGATIGAAMWLVDAASAWRQNKRRDVADASVHVLGKPQGARAEHDEPV